MRNFIDRHPVYFAIAITVFEIGLGFMVFLLFSFIKAPDSVRTMVALIVTTALPLAFIWGLHWWQDAGFTAKAENAQVLWFPLVTMVVPIIVFGAVSVEASMVRLFLVALFLTGLSEEALSRGLLLRALLPSGKWYAVLVPAVLFGLSHITQFLFLGLPLADNLRQMAFNITFGILYGALRLRIGSIWPLIIIHMFGDVFFILAGAVPGALLEMPVAVEVGVGVLEVAYAIYIMRKPSVVSFRPDVAGK